MAKNPVMPVSDRNELIPILGRRALSRTVDDTLSDARDVTLQSNTAIVRVFAKTAGIFVRGATGALPGNWDWFVPANQSVDIVIPDEVTVLSFIQESANAKLIMAEYD